MDALRMITTVSTVKSAQSDASRSGITSQRESQEAEIAVEELVIVHEGLERHGDAASSDPEWKYVSVRRTADVIEDSLYDGLDWVVFEPNDEPTWDAVPVHTPDWTDFNDGDPGAVGGGESIVPGSGLMEAEEEDELQTRPADAVSGDGGLGPLGPGGPTEVSGDSGLGPVPEIGQVMGDAGVSPLPAPHPYPNITLKRGVPGDAEPQGRLITDVDVNEAPADEFVFLPAGDDATGMYPGMHAPKPMAPAPTPIPYPNVPSIPDADTVVIEEVDAFWFA